ncbi:MAG TPA: NnrS family protein [Burkholderiaceae bacterium]|jgi:uncharacterized protein involved in response to NO|nr:NnrS family protein [Burkholderiaceae bacterium]
MREIQVSRGTNAARTPSAARSQFALWNLGFRPFYLLASVFAASSMLVWTAQFSGWLPAAPVRGPVGHGHEMLFGFTIAVVAGFLLTAVRNWTGQPTPTGASLMGLAALWLAGRLLALTPAALPAAIASAAFPIAIAVAIALPLLRAGNARNYFFIGLLSMLALLGAAVQIALLVEAPWSPRLALQLGLDVVLFVMAVMGGRVIPMFTNNGVTGTDARRHPLLEKLALGSVLALFAADAMGLGGAALALLASFAAAAHSLRLALWQPWRTLRTPLVWILHAGYAWLVLHLWLRGLSAAGLVAESFAMHALTVGAIGSLTIGMMVRTARGHTGRMLRADRFETACFVLIQLAALMRVAAPIAVPSLYLAGVQAAGVLWSCAFALYAIRYWPVLTRPRTDGQPG